jgi:hypothetical protein
MMRCTWLLAGLSLVARVREAFRGRCVCPLVWRLGGLAERGGKKLMSASYCWLCLPGFVSLSTVILPSPETLPPVSCSPALVGGKLENSDLQSEEKQAAVATRPFPQNTKTTVNFSHQHPGCRPLLGPPQQSAFFPPSAPHRPVALVAPGHGRPAGARAPLAAAFEGRWVRSGTPRRMLRQGCRLVLVVGGSITKYGLLTTHA